MPTQFIFARMAALALVAIAAWRAWRMFRPRRSLLDNPVTFFLLIGLCLLVMRWPEIKWPHELNPDESQLLVEGARLLKHPLPWRDVDGTTSGPINYLSLSLPLFLGAPFSWETSRIALWVAQCLTLILVYLALRTFGSRAEAQFILLPTIFFYAFVIHLDFAHYSSETMPSLLLAGCFCLLCKEWSAPAPSLWRFFALGCLAGAMPFAKLQTLPLAMFLVLIALAQVVFKYRQTGRLSMDWWRGCSAICLGALLVPTVILGAVTAGGAEDDFWRSYIVAAASYTAQETLHEKFHTLHFLFSHPTSDFRYYDFGAMTALLVLLLVWRGRISRLGHRLLWPLVVISGCIGLTWFCLFVAGKPYHHYMYLLVPPLAIAFGLAFFGVRKLLADPGQAEPAPAGRWNHAFLAGCVLIIGIQSRQGLFYVKNIGAFESTPANSRISPVAKNILSISSAGDTMSVWGWMPAYYVETGLLPATRDTICHYVITPNPGQNYFRERYLKDLEQNPPEIFVDAVAGGVFRWVWTTKESHESFPALARFIQENYTPWSSILYTNEASNAVPIRIYFRKDRMAAGPHTVTALAFRSPADAAPF